MTTPDTIIITGASQGIGRALSVYFGAKGGHIFAMSRNVENLEHTRKLVEEAGGTCDVVAVDLSDGASINAALHRLGETPVDVLINNAADVTSKPFLETSPEEVDHLVRTNITGTLQLTLGVAPLMKGRANPVIVNVSSLAGYKPNSTQTVYSITKTAVNGMSDALRAELKPHGIAVTNLALSSVDTGDGANPDGVPIDVVARKLEAAVISGQDEVFLSPVSKWLMRLYKFLPGLAKLT